jgi:hypothetical protein
MEYVTRYCCIILDFILRNHSGIPKNTTFRKLDLFPSSVQRTETLILLGPLKRGDPNQWFNVRNVVFFRIPDYLQTLKYKKNNPEYS